MRSPPGLSSSPLFEDSTCFEESYFEESCHEESCHEESCFEESCFESSICPEEQALRYALPKGNFFAARAFVCVEITP